MKNIIRSLAFATAIGLASTTAMSEETVKIGKPTWTGAQAIAHLLKAVVETRIGGTAELVPGNNATIFQGMDQGKGDIDVHPDVWLPNQEAFTKNMSTAPKPYSFLKTLMKVIRVFAFRKIRQGQPDY